MRRAPTPTKRARRFVALNQRERDALAMPPGANRERQLAEVTRSRVAMMMRLRTR